MKLSVPQSLIRLFATLPAGPDMCCIAPRLGAGPHHLEGGPTVQLKHHGEIAGCHDTRQTSLAVQAKASNHTL